MKPWEEILLMLHRRILVADDDGATREALAEFLESEGYEVCLAKDGGEAIGLFPSFKPDLVLTDLHMPVLTGEQVLARLRETSPNTPVMIITARPTMDARREAERLGAANFLNKPLKLTDVLARIDELIPR